MSNKDCTATGNLLKRNNGIKVMAALLWAVITLSSCGQKDYVAENSDINGSVPILAESSEVYSSVEETVSLNEEKVEIPKVEISMEDAMEIGFGEASGYYDNLLLTEVHSWDNDEMPSLVSGSDGKREWWCVNFANEDTNYVSVIIHNGEVDTVEYFDRNYNNGLFDMDEVQLTPQEAVQMAQKLGVRGGNPDKPEEWVSGFNFKMSYESLVSAPDDKRIFLEVIGISPNGNFAHVDFDAVTREMLLAEEKIEYSNGDVEWKPIVVENN